MVSWFLADQEQMLSDLCKSRSVGSNTCIIQETVRVIYRTLHMVNSDPLTMNGALGIMV